MTVAIDLSDMLRAHLVFTVSSFDAFVHDLVLAGLKKIFAGDWPETLGFRQFRLNACEAYGVDAATLTAAQFENYVRARNSGLSFQSVRAVQRACGYIRAINIWQEVAASLSLPVDDVENRFSLIVDRRNAIVHEADLLPVYAGVRNAIDVSTVERAATFIRDVSQKMFDVLTR